MCPLRCPVWSHHPNQCLFNVQIRNMIRRWEKDLPYQIYDFIISENIWVYFLKMNHFNLRRVFFPWENYPSLALPSPWFSGFILPTMTLISPYSNHMKEGKKKILDLPENRIMHSWYSCHYVFCPQWASYNDHSEKITDLVKDGPSHDQYVVMWLQSQSQ